MRNSIQNALALAVAAFLAVFTQCLCDHMDLFRRRIRRRRLPERQVHCRNRAGVMLPSNITTFTAIPFIRSSVRLGSHPNALGYQLPASAYAGPAADSPTLDPTHKTVDFYANGASYDGIFL